MKRSSVALVLGILFVLIACGGSDTTASISETPAVTSSDETSVTPNIVAPAAVGETAPIPVEAKPLTNGDFETGDLSGWTADVVDDSWGNWFIYEDGDIAPSSGDRKYAYNVFELPDPPQGTFAAASDSPGPGRYILYQDFTVDAPMVLHLVVYYRVRGIITAPQHFDFLGMNDEQVRNDQFRVDVIDTAAAIESLAEGDVFGTLFQNADSDPRFLEPTEVSLDLTPFVGQTVRLRIVQIDNTAAFMSGFDNVRLEPAS